MTQLPASDARHRAPMGGQVRRIGPSEQKPSKRRFSLFASSYPARRLKTTREGKFYIAITFGVGFVAILTANNLLYLVLGMLLSLIVVSGVLSESSLRGIVVRRRLPVRAQVGRPHLVEIEVKNEKRRTPSYAIEIEDLRAGQPADKRCFFLKVAPDSSQVAAYRRVPARRGLDRHVGFRVATRFPFGFFEKSREITSEEEIIVYPAVDQVVLPPARDGLSADGAQIASRGRGDELLGLRMMREGDDPRDIYWKRSTAGPQNVVIERAREVRAQVRLTLPNLLRAEAPSDDEKRLLEKRVRDVASRAVAHLGRGETVVIEATSGARVQGSQATGADPILRFLALIELEKGGAKADAAVRLASQELPEDAAGEPTSPGEVTLTTAPLQLSRPARLPSRRNAP